MALPLSVMRAHIDSVITANGSLYTVQRLSATKNDAGKHSGSFATISGGTSVRLWIQRVGGISRVAPQGLSAETTHMGFQSRSGVALVPKDRISKSGTAYVWDVIRVLEYETQNEIELKQVRRA